MPTDKRAPGDSAADPGDEYAVALHEEFERATARVAELQTDYDEMLADPAVIQEDRDATALVLEHARRQLEAAQAAVARLDAGAAGRCVKCGGEIGAERLEALVGVTTCVRCA